MILINPLFAKVNVPGSQTLLTESRDEFLPISKYSILEKAKKGAYLIEQVPFRCCSIIFRIVDGIDFFNQNDMVNTRDWLSNFYGDVSSSLSLPIFLNKFSLAGILCC